MAVTQAMAVTDPVTVPVTVLVTDTIHHSHTHEDMEVKFFIFIINMIWLFLTVFFAFKDTTVDTIR